MVKQYSAGGRPDLKRLPHDICQGRKLETGAPLPAMWLLHGVYQTNPARVLHLPQGSARLDVVGYDRHVNDDRQDDGREHIQGYHLNSSHASRPTT